jgi:hypothetical protein
MNSRHVLIGLATAAAFIYPQLHWHRAPDYSAIAAQHGLAAEIYGKAAHVAALGQEAIPLLRPNDPIMPDLLDMLAQDSNPDPANPHELAILDRDAETLRDLIRAHRE